MQKTRLGISAGLLGAAIYFVGLFSGYLVAVVLTGYVLLFEENSWLRKSAVKAVFVMALFSLLITVLNLVPNAISFINDFTSQIASSSWTPSGRKLGLPQPLRLRKQCQGMLQRVLLECSTPDSSSEGC